VSEDNVTPIAPVQECASCGSRHTQAERFRLDAHNDGCMQPEIRMKRLEARVQALDEHLAWLIRRNGETHGTSEAAPDTQRSGSPVRTYACSACYFGLERGHSSHTCGAPADASPAEPERSQAAGAEPPGEERGQP
jgi:hypothetical protein